MYTISRLAKQYGLSRSTLLYYDSIGLLSPTERTESQYRLYSEEDRVRLEKICLYRQMGISLKDIKKILNAKSHTVTTILEKNLQAISEQIRSLRQQQFAIVELLKNENIIKQAGVLSKEAWVNILRSTGLNEEEMDKWHQEFEKNAPQAHHDFLISLGIPEKEVRAIRRESIQNAE